MIVDDLFENVAGPEKCWPGYRKVGTKPGTGRNKGKRVNDCEKIKESVGKFQIGDPVVITGNVEYQGKTGDVQDIGRDGAFVVVDLYNYGPHSFHSTDVSYNDYADSDDDAEYQQGVAEGKLSNWEVFVNVDPWTHIKVEVEAGDYNTAVRKAFAIAKKQGHSYPRLSNRGVNKLSDDVAEASDISGLMAAASMVQDYIITAEVDGQTRRFRVRGMTGPRAARERFLKHASQARVIDVKPAAEKNVAEADQEKIGDRYDAEEFDQMMLRLKTLAGAGPLKTVWDPERRVYKNVPINPQNNNVGSK